MRAPKSYGVEALEQVHSKDCTLRLVSGLGVLTFRRLELSRAPVGGLESGTAAAAGSGGDVLRSRPCTSQAYQFGRVRVPALNGPALANWVPAGAWATTASTASPPS